jgi:hypothetical protein
LYISFNAPVGTTSANKRTLLIPFIVDLKGLIGGDNAPALFGVIHKNGGLIRFLRRQSTGLFCRKGALLAVLKA